MNSHNNYKALPSVDKRCFGCSVNNPYGLQMKFFTDEESLFSWVTVPDHLCGWGNLVHGGVISTILDEVMSWAAIYLLKKIILTKSMTVDFIKPVYIGNEIKAVGKVLQFNNDHEAAMEGLIYNNKGKLCAKSTGTYSLLTPETIKRLGLIDQEVLNNFEIILKE